MIFSSSLSFLEELHQKLKFPAIQYITKTQAIMRKDIFNSSILIGFHVGILLKLLNKYFHIAELQQKFKKILFFLEKTQTAAYLPTLIY